MDVIKIRIKQEFNGSPADNVDYWFANDFGAIKLWGDNGYVIRRICDADDQYSCQCVENWMSGNRSNSGGTYNPPNCGPGTGVEFP